MTELFNNLGSYLHDVFVIKFDAWVILGFVAQGLFTMRFVVQWIASERARKSVMPVAFWFFSIGGGVLALDVCAVSPRSRIHRRPGARARGLHAQSLLHHRQRPAILRQRLKNDK